MKRYYFLFFLLAMLMSGQAAGQTADSCQPITAADLPYVMDFDSIAITDPEIPCWTKLSFLANFPNAPTVTSSCSTTPGGHSLMFTAFDNTAMYAVMPAVDSMDGRVVRFAWMMGASASLQVGTMVAPDDTSTFHTLLTIPSGNGVGVDIPWEVSLAALGEDSSHGRHVAFRAGCSGGSFTGESVFLDDVTMMVAPDCFRPMGIWFSDITSITAMAHIVDPLEAMHYCLVFGDDSLVVNDTVVLLDNLVAGADYTVRAYTVCGDSMATGYVSGSFHVPCNNIVVTESLPYEEGFESWSDDFSPCWQRRYLDRSSGHRLVADTGVAVFVDTLHAHSGRSSLCLDLHYENYMYYYPFVSLPVFEGPVQRLRMSFWCKLSQNFTNQKLAVGVSRSADDSATFTRVATLALPDTGWHRYEVDLGDYVGSGGYVTFFHAGTISSHNCCYIDDIHIEVPSCLHPVGVTVAALAPTSALLTWEDYSYANDYRIVVDGDEAEAITAHSTSYLLTVEPDSLYTVAVSTLCGGGYSEGRTVSFRTPCLPLAHGDLPWGESFDTLAIGLNDPDPATGCMRLFRRSVGAYTLQYYPHTVASPRYGESGSSLMFNIHYGQPQMVVLPLFADDLYSLMLSARIYGTDTSAALELGVVTNAHDPSSFLPVDTLRIAAVGSWTYVEHRFLYYEGPDGHIALRPMGSSSSYTVLYLDDIAVGEAVDCWRPQGIDLVEIGPSEVSLTVVDSLGQGSYRVWLTSPTDPVVHSQDILGDEAVFDSLVPNTHYTAHAAALCSGVVTSSVERQFATPCGAFAMPWGEDFGSLNSNTMFDSCWSVYSGEGASIDSVVAGTGDLSEHTNYIFYVGNSGPDAGIFASRHLSCNLWNYYSRFNWIVTPSVAIDGLSQLSFTVALTSGSGWNPPAGDLTGVRFIVAVTTDEGLTWTPLASWEGDTAALRSPHSTLSPTAHTVALPLTGYDGENVRIGFYFEIPDDISYTRGSIHIDNIFIESAACPAPVDPVVTDTGNATATIGWRGDGGLYEYRYAPEADTSAWTCGTVADTGVSLVGLSHSTDYLFGVRSLCGADHSRWISLSFRTLCGTIGHDELPYREGFDTYRNLLDPCWSRLDFYMTSPYFPLINNSYFHNGSQSLYFFSNHDISPEYAISPLFDSLNDLYVSFWGFTPNIISLLDSATCFQVGVMGDPSDTATFSLVASVAPSTANSWENFKIALLSDNSASGHIAFRVPKTNNTMLLIDEVFVDRLDFCSDSVLSFSVADITGTSATLEATLAFGLYDSVVLSLTTVGGTPLQSFTALHSPLSTLHFPLASLSPGTDYGAYLTLYCHGSIVATAALAFSTTPLSIPNSPLSTLNSQLSIYPNPSHGDVTISRQDAGGPAEVSVLDMTGRIVLAPTTLNSQFPTLNFSHLPAGPYFVRVVMSDAVEIRKIIIE